MTATFLHGGGDNPAARSIAFGRFTQAYLTGVSGPLLVVATADTETEARQTAEFYCDLFAELSVPRNWLVPVLVDPDVPLMAEHVAAYSPSGIFVCGGPTPLYHRALCTDLGWVAYLRDRAIPYGGTSAGAAIAAERAILGGWRANGEGEPRQFLFQGASEGLDDLTVRPGLGLVPFAVDVHAGQLGTLTRLIQAASRKLVKEGWAIDENTLLVVHPTRLHLYGQGFAYRVVSAAEDRVSVRTYAAPAAIRRR